MDEDQSTTWTTKLSSADLAALVVDALVQAGLVKEESVAKAMAIAIEEIDARKCMGDY